MKKQMFTEETIKLIQSGVLGYKTAIAHGAIDAAAIGADRDTFAKEFRKVAKCKGSTAVFSAALRAAKEDGATLDSILNAITGKMADEAKKAKVKRSTKGEGEDLGKGEGEDLGKGEGEDLGQLTLAQLEAIREQLEKRLAIVRGLIANKRKNTAPDMGDAAVGGC